MHDENNVVVIFSTCFGHSCGHPQGGALRKINTLICYKMYVNKCTCKIFNIKITWFKIRFTF
jgi:hypothetical protein